MLFYTVRKLIFGPVLWLFLFSSVSVISNTNGIDGRKGERGEPGLPESDGIPGLSGCGGIVDKAGAICLKGEPGVHGIDGINGDKGEKGEAGVPGKEGPVGPKGDRGDTGEPGLPGPTGTDGAPGLPGLINFISGARGDPGSVGAPGLPGPAGPEGSPGPLGLKGFRGDDGEPGSIGPTGPPGMPGLDGYPGATPPTSYILVQHSQSPDVPSCNAGQTKLWEGYSLLYIEANEKSHHQDLGNAGSCLQRFSTVPFVSCNINGVCYHASRNDRSFWLTTNKTIPMIPVAVTDVQPYISRCAVCSARTNVIAIHSQTTSIPNCPSGWSSLWDGYSFAMHTAVGSSASGQSFSSSGSCLKEFHTTPFIECNDARGICHYFANKHSYWLSTVDASEQFKKPARQTFKSGSLKARVSRCKVCSLNM